MIILISRFVVSRAAARANCKFGWCSPIGRLPMHCSFWSMVSVNEVHGASACLISSWWDKTMKQGSAGSMGHWIAITKRKHRNESRSFGNVGMFVDHTVFV